MILPPLVFPALTELKGNIWNGQIATMLKFFIRSKVTNFCQVCQMLSSKIHVCKSKKISTITIIFLAGFAGQEILDKDPTVWLDGLDLPTPESFPPFQGHAHAAFWCTHQQKYVCKYIKMDFCKHKRNSQKEFD